jgi:hypothetical protein
MAEMVNNGSSIEEWNKQVDETEKLYINTEAFIVMFIGIAMIFFILGIRGVIEFYTGITIGILSMVIGFMVDVFYMPKYREKIKFFVKKR